MQTDLWTYEITLPEMPDLTRFDVEATDGSIGHVDEASYDVGASYLVLDTGPRIFGKKVLLPASVIQRIDSTPRRSIWVSPRTRSSRPRSSMRRRI
jgi:hypothetical protein